MDSINNQSTVQNHNEENEYNFKINTEIECYISISIRNEIIFKI